MDGTAKAHQSEYGVEPEILIEIPQVTTLLGAFAEYCSGYALMSTNSHGLRVAISRRDDNQVRVLNATRNERKRFQLTALKDRKEDKWAVIIKAVCQTFISSELAITGFDMTFKGQSALADALSLTAAIVSGMVYGINELYGFGMDANAMMRLSFSANRFMSKYSSRLCDLVTLFTAESGKIIFFDLESYDYTTFDYPFVNGFGVGSYFIDCSLPEGELSGEVAIFRESCSQGALLAKEYLTDGDKLRTLSEKGIRQLHLPLPEDLKRAVSFLVEDSGFAKKAFDAIKNGDATAFGKIFYAQQRNLSELAVLTSPEVEWLVKRGIELAGVKGVTEISVGISGTLVALIEDSVVENYRKQLEEYEKIFGFHPVMREYVPSTGLKVISSDEYSSL